MKKFICILMICALVFAPVCTIGVSAAVPYDNMIALYNMADGMKDVISGKSGQLVNGASIVQDGERGNVLFCNNEGGVTVVNDGQWAELAGHHIPDSDEMTVSLWFKAKEHLEGAPRVYEVGDARPLTQGDTVPLRFICIHPHRSLGDIGVQATLNCNDLTDVVPNNRDRAFSEPDTAVLDKWVHVVWVINKGKPNTMYVNGVPHYSHHGGGPSDPAEDAVFSPKDVLNAPEGQRNALLGRSGEEGTAAVNPCFNGYISDVAIFSVALAADQVAELSKVDFSKGNPAAAAPAPVAEVVAPVVEAAPAPVPVAAATVPAATTTAPRTGDSVSILIVLMGIALIGSGIYTYSKRARNY